MTEILTYMGAGSLAVVGCEKLYCHRRSQDHGRFSAVAGELPLFIALKAVGC